MTTKKYLSVRIIAVIIVAALTSYAITIHNYFLPIPVILAWAAFLYIIRRKVTDVIADERDYKIAGQAARYTLTAFSMIGIITIFILLSYGENSRQYVLGNILASTICLVMLTNAFIFKWLSSRK